MKTKPKSFIHLFVLILMLVTTACKRTCCDCYHSILHQKQSAEYTALMQKSIFNYIGNFQQTNDELYLDSALILLDKAIQMDPTKYSAYLYKTMALYWKQDYQEAINVVDQIIALDYEMPDLIFLQAMMYDEIGETEKANAALDLAEQGYNNWLDCYPDSIALITSKIEFTAYAYGQEDALKEFNKAFKKHPTDIILMSYQDILENDPGEIWLFRKKQ